MSEYRRKIVTMSALAVLLAVAVAFSNIFLIGMQQPAFVQKEMDQEVGFRSPSITTTTVSMVVATQTITEMTTEKKIVTSTATAIYTPTTTTATATPPPRATESVGALLSQINIQIRLSENQLKPGDIQRVSIQLLNISRPISGRVEGHVILISTGEELFSFYGRTDSLGYFEVSWMIGDTFEVGLYSVKVIVYLAEPDLVAEGSEEFEVIRP